jgi:hypothetical protein
MTGVFGLRRFQMVPGHREVYRLEFEFLEGRLAAGDVINGPLSLSMIGGTARGEPHRVTGLSFPCAIT